MAVFSSVTCANMADIISGIKAFLLQNGFSLSGESAADGLTRWTASKGARSHAFTAAENAKFPLIYCYDQYSDYQTWWENTARPAYEYSAALGIRSASFTAADISFITGGLVFPCRMDMFVTGDADVFLSFQLDEHRWVHLYSGGMDTALAGNSEGGEVFSGSTFPGYYSSWYATYYDKDMYDSRIGIFNTYNASVYYSDAGNKSLRTCLAALVGNTWCGPYFNQGYRGDRDSYISRGEINTNIYSACGTAFSEPTNTMKYIANVSRNALTGLPTLFPIRFFRTSDHKYLGKVPDIYMCSGLGYKPGSSLVIGTHGFRLYPLHNDARSNLFLAVRSN